MKNLIDKIMWKLFPNEMFQKWQHDLITDAGYKRKSKGYYVKKINNE
tara:strand:- start:62174 stop:62314 length:141 start_codon:yes stop_codon:yes gene_type:complete